MPGAGGEPGPETVNPRGTARGDGLLPRAPTDRVCTVAMVLGILAVIIPFAELALSLPAIACGIAGLRRTRRTPQGRGGKKRAMAGLILGIIGLLLCVPSALILAYIL